MSILTPRDRDGEPVTPPGPGAYLDAVLVGLAQAIYDDRDRLTELEERVSALEGTTPEPPEPPPAGTMVYGYGHTNRARLEADTGVLVCADRHFAGGKPIPPTWNGWDPASLPARYYPICSFKPGNWDTAGTGKDADNFRSFLESVPRDIALIPHHEPENDGRSPASFRGMIDRYDAIAADVANPHVRMAYVLMRSWVDKPAGQRSEDYIVPKDQLASDWVLSWDGYNMNAGDSAAKLFGPLVALCEEYGYPFAISETATSIGSHAAAWVQEITDYADANDAVWCCYWPSQTSDPDADDFYPPSSAFGAFADVALANGGTPA